MNRNNNVSAIPLVIVNGPTAVGKSEAAVELALRLNGEIISADSMQVYRGMDIGTAKITTDEMKGVKHHMIDVLEPDENFDVIRFKDMTKALIADIYGRGKLPIIAGGTGYYIQAALYDVEFTEYDDERQQNIRAALEEELKASGAVYMHEKLRRIDTDSAAVIHPNNTKRLLHALEYFELTGRMISEHNKDQSQRESPYRFIYFVLTDDRERIYERINSRVDLMLEAGLEKEVRDLLSRKCTRDMQSMLGIGYKEMADYIYGEVSFEEMRENIMRETRHFAKKQLTWFKREKDVTYIDRRDYPDNASVVDRMEALVRRDLIE